MDADDKLQHLTDTYRQERPGFAPWPFINTLSDDELRADIHIAGTVHDGRADVIAAWLAQALRMRPNLLQYPAGW